MDIEDTSVLSLQVAEAGIELTVAFAADDRKDLARVHTFLVGFDHEEFGQAARDLVQQAEELAWEIETNYRRQPKTGAGDE